MESRHILHVRFERQWSIEYGGRTYGPWPSKQEAVATARTWAENAAKQGHSVQVVIHEVSGPAFSLINIEAPFKPGSGYPQAAA